MAHDDADPAYPAHWEADVLLLDGTAARLRPIRPSDAELLVEFYARVSPESKYKRFFASYPTLSDRDVDRFSRVDYHNRVALIVTLAQDMVAVGRFDKVSDDEAEVAFLVQDDQQGRGVGQLLLEHLAQAGRECGVARFVAEMLPQNTRMSQTFNSAGYRIADGVNDEVLTVTLVLDHTETSVGVMLSREHRAEARSMQRLLSPSSVAVIGASRRSDTVGSRLVRNLVLGGYAGKVYVVNPAADSVAGMPAYDSVEEIPGGVELAIVAVPAESMDDVVLGCAANGVHGLVVVSSGFSETGEEGKQRQRTLVGLARSYGLRLVGPNCLGVINTAEEVSLNASLVPSMPPQGRVGFFSQSGALGVTILETVSRRGLGLSTFVSAGNRADVSVNDLLQYWEEDSATEVVLLYLESIGNPRKFSRIARRVARQKPIVAVRSGLTTQGVPMGHEVTSPVAPQSAIDALFGQAGVIQVDTLEDMFDVGQLVAHQPLPNGRRIAVIGNSDALGLLTADFAAAAGLRVEHMASLGADARGADFERALVAAMAADVDAVVAVYIPLLDTRAEEVANVLASVGSRCDKPLVSTFLAAKGVPELLRVPYEATGAGRGSVPSYRTPEAAVRALARVVEHSRWLQRPPGARRSFTDIDKAAGRRIVDRCLRASPGGAELLAEETSALLGSYGIDVVPVTPATTLDEAIAAGAAAGWDVALKATAERVRQRPDLAHVWRTIGGPDDMLAAWTNLTAIIDDPEHAAFVVQPMAPPGIPLTIAALEDPLFGPIVAFGMAGAPSELLGDVAYRIPPLTDADAADLVREVRAAPLLFGYRGSEVVDVRSVEEIVLRLAQLKDDLPSVQALDLELVLAGAQGAAVLRATGRVLPVPSTRTDDFTRRLSNPAASAGIALGRRTASG